MTSDDATRPPIAEWIEGNTESDGRALHTLVLHNVPEGSRVWFQELYDGKTAVEGPKMHHYQGTSWYIDIPHSGTITLKYYGRPLPRQRWAPEAFILQQQGKPDLPMEIIYHLQELPPEEPTHEVRHDEVQPADIIPQIKRIHYGTEPMEATEKHPNGWYRITTDANGNPIVEADDDDGAFHAQVTLSKLSRNASPDVPCLESPLTLEDWPDYPYRGFMLDVARDFRTVDEVRQIINLMASWKMNTLHFHLADDESWCLEIKELPELTEFGGRHALPDWNLQETQALKPTINGRIGNTTFYTAEEYQQIIHYAKVRNVQHLRLVALVLRQYREGAVLLRLGEGSRHLPPAPFRVAGFRLHREADIPLPAIHIGGDEVPSGAWSGKDRHAMKELFINGMLDLAEQRGIRLAGWEDIARGLEPETEERLKRSLYFINVWNTKGIDGFPTVLSPASYTYLDLAYSPDPREIGLHWAGYVDERKAFELQPNDYLGDIIGIEAALWSSQLRSFEDATYQMLPKAMGIAERGWNKQSDDFNRFYSIIVAREMPVWKAKGFTFKKR